MVADESDESDQSEDENKLPKVDQVPAYLLDRMFRNLRGVNKVDVVGEFVRTNVRNGIIPVALLDLLIIRQHGKRLDRFFEVLKIENPEHLFS